MGCFNPKFAKRINSPYTVLNTSPLRSARQILLTEHATPPHIAPQGVYRRSANFVLEITASLITSTKQSALKPPEFSEHAVSKTSFYCVKRYIAHSES